MRRVKAHAKGTVIPRVSVKASDAAATAAPKLESICLLPICLALVHIFFIATFVNTFFVVIGDFHLAVIQLNLTFVSFNLALVRSSLGTACHQRADNDCEKKDF